jgi:hypothetical protein
MCLKVIIRYKEKIRKLYFFPNKLSLMCLNEWG